MLLRPVALGAHLFALFCISLAVFLGFWQLGSWQDHRDRAAAQHVERPAIDLDDALGPDDPFPKGSVGRTVSVAGTWLPESTVYVRDRERNGEIGYWVATPIAVTGDDDSRELSEVSALYVVRGWTDSIEPRPEPPTGSVTLEAWLQPAEGTAGVVDDDRTDDIVPQIRMGDVVQHVNQDLYGGYAVVRPAVDQPGDATGELGADGLEQVGLDQVPEVAATTGLKNFLYAVEWWIFAGFAAFIWIRWCRDELNPETDEAAPEPGEAAEGDAADTPDEREDAVAEDLESAG